MLLRMFFSVMVAISVVTVVAAECRGLTLTFLDVGEGDSCVLMLPHTDPIVIDAANPSSVFKTVDFLRAHHQKDLAALILTHPHLDHIGGALTLQHLFSPRKIYDNGQLISQAPQDSDFLRWYSDEIRTAPNYQPLAKGGILSFGDMHLDVIAPAVPLTSLDWNTNSVVMMLSYGKFNTLLMGDGNLASEKSLLRNKFPLHADILKTGPHGAADTGSQEFIKAVSLQRSL